MAARYACYGVDSKRREGLNSLSGREPVVLAKRQATWPKLDDVRSVFASRALFLCHRCRSPAEAMRTIPTSPEVLATSQTTIRASATAPIRADGSAIKSTSSEAGARPTSSARSSQRDLRRVRRLSSSHTSRSSRRRPRIIPATVALIITAAVSPHRCRSHTCLPCRARRPHGHSPRSRGRRRRQSRPFRHHNHSTRMAMRTPLHRHRSRSQRNRRPRHPPDRPPKLRVASTRGRACAGRSRRRRLARSSRSQRSRHCRRHRSRRRSSRPCPSRRLHRLRTAIIAH